MCPWRFLKSGVRVLVFLELQTLLHRVLSSVSTSGNRRTEHLSVCRCSHLYFWPHCLSVIFPRSVICCAQGISAATRPRHSPHSLPLRHERHSSVSQYIRERSGRHPAPWLAISSTVSPKGHVSSIRPSSGCLKKQVRAHHSFPANRG